MYGICYTHNESRITGREMLNGRSIHASQFAVYINSSFLDEALFQMNSSFPLIQDSLFIQSHG